jgi:hypothetical protein
VHFTPPSSILFNRLPEAVYAVAGLSADAHPGLRDGLANSIVRTSASTFGTGQIGVDHDDVGVQQTGLLPCNSSPASGCRSSTTVSASSRTAVSHDRR